MGLAPLPPPPSPSPLIVIRETPGAGRGAFAARAVPGGTQLLVADDLAAHVLLREHRGEVCWECFAYDRGRKLPVRDAVHGFAFCSDACAARLRDRHDDACLQAWAAIERALRSGRATSDYDDDDEEPSRPSIQAIDQAWGAAASTAASILSARRAGGPGPAGFGTTTRAHRRALQRASSGGPPPPPLPPADVLSYQMHAVAAARRAGGPGACPPAALLSLADEPRPYASRRELRDHVAAYLFLLAVLPGALLPFATPAVLRAAKSREVHNSFGIRSLEDGGSEFFGYGVWPSASYFNHSCRPNVGRRRVGRRWVFEAGGDVGEGQELCISYLNGEEEVLTAEERRARLRKTWGFECGCQRCGEP